MRLVHAGPYARYLTFDEPPSAELSRRLGALAHALRSVLPAGLYDVVPGHADVLVEGRYLLDDERLARAVAGAEAVAPPEPRRFEVSVAYGDRADVSELCDRLALSWDEIVARHAAATYSVAYLGFTPGFPYLHGADPRLTTPRRARPRPDVPAGAVAIAQGQAGIYPTAGPGGWWLLGTTPFHLFDPELAEPTTLRAGDEVRFVPAPTRPQRGGAAPEPRGHPGAPVQVEPLLTVLEVWPSSASLQGAPRRGVGHFGLAEAGALDQRLFRALAAAVGAPLTAPALELTVPHTALRAEADVVAVYGGAARAALDGAPLEPGRPFAWRRGATLELRPPDAGAALAGVPLLAVSGGLAPLGGPVGHEALAVSGSTDTRGHVGGFGRWLRPGDVLANAAPPRPGRVAGSLPPLGHYPARLSLRLHPGPLHLGAAFAALQARTFAVAERSRMGVRLEPIAGAADPAPPPSLPSTGTPVGAVQLPPDGRPLVLLADRGRTGGYAVAGVVDRRDLAALAQARPGTLVTFTVPDRTVPSALT